jgi:hypothetical protein
MFFKNILKIIFKFPISILKETIFYLIYYFRIFYLQLFALKCEKCGTNFFHVYLSFNPINCPCCSQEYCQYCIEIKSENNTILSNGNVIQNNISKPHDKIRCLQRYTIIYIPALLVFLIWYLKFVFVCNSNFITKYLTVTLFILEYIIFNDKVDNLINTCLSIKNIILGILLLIYYEEKDIIIYLVVGMIQLIIILLINLLNDIVKQKINEIKQSQIIKVLGKIF